MSDTPAPFPNLSERDALVAYATMINTGNVSAFGGLLAADFKYTSQNVLTDMVGKDTYLEFMAAKFATMHKAGLMPMADLARLPGYGHADGVVLWQGNPPEPQCVAYVDIADGAVKALHLCIVPNPALGVPYSLWPGLPPDRPRPTRSGETPA